MTIIVTDAGFRESKNEIAFQDYDGTIELGAATKAVDLASDADPNDLADALDQIDIIRVDFPSFADGRGMTIARRLRLMGFTGTLRARGHVIADQYAMARRSGFDEVEISHELAGRQPVDQWLYRANWREHDYQNRLRG